MHAVIYNIVEWSKDALIAFPVLTYARSLRCSFLICAFNYCERRRRGERKVIVWWDNNGVWREGDGTAGTVIGLVVVWDLAPTLNDACRRNEHRHNGRSLRRAVCSQAWHRYSSRHHNGRSINLHTLGLQPCTPLYWRPVTSWYDLGVILQGAPLPGPEQEFELRGPSALWLPKILNHLFIQYSSQVPILSPFKRSLFSLIPEINI